MLTYRPERVNDKREPSWINAAWASWFVGVSRRAASRAALAMLVLLAGPVEAAPRSWPEEKCARYELAWRQAFARRGEKGLGREFLASHAAFLASGCTAAASVCPRSAEELDLANIMVISAMNAGMASTFPPFACRK